MNINIPLAFLVGVTTLGIATFVVVGQNAPQNTLPEVPEASLALSDYQSEALTVGSTGYSNHTADTQTKASVTSEKIAPANTGIPAQKTSATPAPFVSTIYYDGSNFLPETVTIPEDGTVVFENVSDKPLWVASANHKTHAKYPIKSAKDCFWSSFDACRAIGKGQSWSFTFTELGEWRYHNHLRDFDTGTVIVLTKKKYLEEVKEAQ